VTTATAAKGARVTSADGMAPGTSARTMLRRAAMGLACAAFVSCSASGCKSIASGVRAPAPAATAAKASSDPACPQAVEAVSTYGPTVVRDAIEDKESLDNAEIGLIVLVLKEAANSADNSGVKHSIINLVSAYLKLRDSLGNTIDSAIEERVLADTSALKSECRS
jgi:hypothetical protein